MRPLNSLDLVAGSRAESEDRARSILLTRSLGIAEEELEELDDSTAMLLERFERVNAAAEIRVALECVACGNHPLLDLDMARFFLREIAAAARRLMGEIHALAGAYGWSEASIAGMSPARRSAYLEMLQA